jgi:hypothetical protein
MSSRGLSGLVYLLLALTVVTAGAMACGGGEEGPSGSPSAEEPALAACQALNDLERYHYVSYYKLESPEALEETPPQPHATPLRPITRPLAGDFLFEYKMDAFFVAPDRTEVVIDAGTGAELGMIAIGEDVWLTSDGAWVEAANAPLPPYRPDRVCDAFVSLLDLSTAQPEFEKIDDLNTIHYALEEVVAQDSMKAMFGSGSDLHLVVHKVSVDIWLEERDKWPVRMEVRGSGFYSDERELRMELVIDVTDVNSDKIRVEPPG